MPSIGARVVRAVGNRLLAKSAYRKQFALLFEEIPAPERGYVNDCGLGVYPLLPTGTPEVSAAESHILERSYSPTPKNYPSASGVVSPLAESQRALRAWNRLAATGDTRFAARALAITDWLVASQTADGAWLYEFPFWDLEPGWASAMAQGEAISSLVRAHDYTGKHQYLETALRGYRFMETPVEASGTLGAIDDDTPMYQEYPGSRVAPHVLNGSIFALIAVRELGVVLGDATFVSRFSSMADALAGRLDRYDIGWWSSYALSKAHEIASPEYHRLHIEQLDVMTVFTEDERWAEGARKWRKYASENWARLIWHKAVASRL